MQTGHTLSEDVEPPSTDTGSSDPRGYHPSRLSIVHDPASFLKTHHLRKNPLRGKKSLSSLFAPLYLSAGDSDGPLGDRFGSFDEDDDRPPSASRLASSGPLDLPRRPGYAGGYLQDPSHRVMVHLPFRGGARRRSRCNRAVAAAVPAYPGRVIGSASLRLMAVSYYSWFRSVPIVRLAPPGICRSVRR
jgi:hypothetical protein